LKRIIQIINRRRRFLLYTPEGYKCYRKHHLKGGIVVEADAVIALMELLTPMEKKKNYE
jgi:hypothetical protein